MNPPGREPNKDLLRIRLDRLEEDCQSNPQLLAEWGYQLALAKKKVKDLKRALKLLGAQLGSEIRSNPETYLGPDRKATDKPVEEAVLQDIAYQEAEKELIDAELEEDILNIFVKAIVERGEQLSNEVKLFGQQYFSKPNTNKPDMEPMGKANQSIGKRKPKV